MTRNIAISSLFFFCSCENQTQDLTLTLYVILALRGLWQEDFYESKLSLGCRVRPYLTLSLFTKVQGLTHVEQVLHHCTTPPAFEFYLFKWLQNTTASTQHFPLQFYYSFLIFTAWLYL